jgi:Nineteen complex-related protein 2
MLDFAEYTSAKERIALGKKSKKLEAQQRRDALKELIADAYVLLCPSLLSHAYKDSERRKMTKRHNGRGSSYDEEDILSKSSKIAKQRRFTRPHQVCSIFYCTRHS